MTRTLSNPLSRIEAEHSRPLTVILEDAVTCERIQNCPAANLNLRVLALEGDFCHDDSAMWSEEEFEAQVVKQRDGKRPLLAGELKVSLKVDLQPCTTKFVNSLDTYFPARDLCLDLF